MFAQDLKSFVTSKTNIVAIAGMAFAVYGFTKGYVSYGELTMSVTAGLSAMGLRDAVHK